MNTHFAIFVLLRILENPFYSNCVTGTSCKPFCAVCIYHCSLFSLHYEMVTDGMRHLYTYKCKCSFRVFVIEKTYTNGTLAQEPITLQLICEWYTCPRTHGPSTHLSDSANLPWYTKITPNAFTPSGFTLNPQIRVKTSFVLYVVYFSLDKWA